MRLIEFRQFQVTDLACKFNIQSRHYMGELSLTPSSFKRQRIHLDLPRTQHGHYLWLSSTS